MSAAFTIILPHLRNPGNDAALMICLDMLIANTEHDFDLRLLAVRGGSLFETVNRMVEEADTDCCVYWSSDMFPAARWDTPMLALWDADTIVTNVLVEPGAIGMHPDNVHKDFGRKPDTFRRAEFEAWAANDAPVPNNFGWYAPFMISRASFLAFGAFQTDLAPDVDGFTGADMLFFEQWQTAGKRIQRARSYTYHLQRYSQEHEQRHEKRDVQS